MKPQEHAPMIKIRKGEKNPVLLPNRSKTPGHSSRFNLIKDFFLVDPTTSRAVRTTNNGAGYSVHLLVGDDCVHNK